MKLSTTDKGGGSAPYDAGFYAARRDVSLQSAGVIVPILLSYVQPRSVVDIGCGLGTWLKAFRAAGITDVMGYDGDYVDRGALLIEPSRFCPTDLRADGRLQRSFDFTGGRRTPAGTVCPLFRAPPHFRRPVVLFSAAIPGQGGTDHINEQWQDYWRDLFLSENFHPVNIIRPAVWGLPEVDFWYQQNSILYCSAAFLSAHPNLKMVARRTSLNLSARLLYLSRVLKQLPRLVCEAIVRYGPRSRI